MAKFNRGGKKEVPPLATTSLPDIVFMLLFFFMATTQLREETALVTVKLPQASEIAKLERKDLASYINIGSPVLSKQAEYGTDARIQLNDSFKTSCLRIRKILLFNMLTCLHRRIEQDGHH